MRRIFIAIATLLAPLFAPLAAVAGTYGTAPGDRVAQVELLPGWREGAVQMAALRIRLQPGWKTYWRAPGDAGIPPSLDWQRSGNLAAARFEWPVPQVFDLGGLRSIGYSGEVVLPLLLTAAEAGAPISLRLELQIGVCHDVCVPVSVTLSAEIPAGGAADPRIRAALADRARTSAEAGLAAVSCTVEPIADGLRVTARLALPAQGGEEVVVFEPGDPTIWASAAEASRAGGTLTAAADLVPANAAPFALDRSRLRITVIGRGRAVDIHGCPAG
jgi:DsbC/DsbD-like thiol-disulfide interchange protein